MSLLFAAAGAVVAALLETSVLPQLTVVGVKPDLVFVLAVVTAMMVGVEDGLVWAFLGGLLLDVLSDRPVGATILSLLIVTGLAIAVARVLGSAPRAVVVGVVLLLTVAYQLASLAILAVTAGVHLVSLPVRSILVAAILNSLLAVLAALVARWALVRFGAPGRTEW